MSGNLQVGSPDLCRPEADLGLLRVNVDSAGPQRHEDVRRRQRLDFEFIIPGWKCGDATSSWVDDSLTENDFRIGVSLPKSPSGSQPKARVSYAAMWYDEVGRPVASADYGTNGGSAFTRPDSAPASSDTALVSTTEYNSSGEAYKTIDPTKAAKKGRIIRAPWQVVFLVELLESPWEQEVANLSLASPTSCDPVERLAARQKDVERCSAK